jgi:hypothetical protein
MKIIHSTELMKNQKHAVIMAPDKQFEVLQTAEGHALFFSIGTDNTFYCTREIPADKHGWSKFDHSSALSADYNKAAVKAKAFDVAQNLTAGTADLALVITVNNSDYLYIALACPNNDAAWAAGNIPWVAIPFDDTTHSFTGLGINDVYIRENGDAEYIVADILTDPSSALQTVFRYFIDPTKAIRGVAWIPHDTSGRLQAGQISTSLGRRQQDAVDGTYVMGSITGEEELIFTPLYNVFRPQTAPTPARILLPPSSTVMALSSTTAPYTDLFVAAGSGLYFLANNQQTDEKTPSLVYTHTFLAGVESLHVNNYNNTVYVWGLNQQGQVFCMRCAAGSEGNTSAWSMPVPIMTGVEGLATFVDNQHGSCIIFAHKQDDTLVQLTQDAITTKWSERHILLPGADVNDMVETYTFTTHIKCTDDNNVPLASTDITITSTDSCSVYINDAYYVVHLSIPLTITSDAVGSITLIQNTDSISGTCYNLSDGTQTVNVNPMLDILGKLDGVKTGTDLDKNVTDEKGNSKPLVDSSITTEDKNEIAAYVAQFVALHSQVPADGSQQTASPVALQATASSTAARPIFGMSFEGGKIQCFSGAEQAASVGLVPNGSNNFSLRKTAMLATAAAEPPQFEILPGDGWRWFKNLIQTIDKWWINTIGEINHFFVQLGEEIYHFAMKCISDIIQGIEFVLNKIKVFFEDLIKWLGSIFGWNDILRTHKVLKNFFMQYSNYCVNNIAEFQSEIVNFTTTVEQYINSWAGLPMDSYQSQMASSSQDGGQNNPSSNWGTHQAQSNIGAAGISAAANSVNALVMDLFQAVINDGEILNAAIDQLKDVFNDFGSMSLTDIVKKVLAIFVDAMLESVENILTAFLKVVGDLIQGVVAILDAPLGIPVISPLYKLFAGEELSLLDLICLVVAIPVTFIYKLANNGDAPFPDDAESTALINASDFNTIAALISPATAAPMAMSTATPTALTIKPPIVPTKLFEKLTWAGNVCAFFGGMLVAILGTIKNLWPDISPKPIAVAYSASYLPYIMPDMLGSAQNLMHSDKGWYNRLNVALAAMAYMKASVDVCSVWDATGATGDNIPAGVPKAGDPSNWTQISPILDLAINAAWEVPAVYYYLDSPKADNDILGLAANTCFNATGVLSPFVYKTQGLPKVALVALSAALNVAYGAMSLGIALDGE